MRVQCELALQVVVGVVAHNRLLGGHDERLQPRLVIRLRINAASELLELEQERSII